VTLFGGQPFAPTANLAIDFLTKRFRQTRTRTNLLLWSQDFSNAVWRKSVGDSVAVDTVVAPNGTLTADAYTWATSTSDFGYLSQRVPGVNATGQFTYSIWAKVPSGTKSFSVQISDVSTTTKSSSVFTLTTTWQRVTFTVTPGQLTNSGQIAVGHMGLNPGDVVHFWNAQLEANPVASADLRSDGTQGSVFENAVGHVDGNAADLGGLYGWLFSRTGSGLADTASGAYQSFATNVPRITDKGLLIEETRTNVIRNSDARIGAVAGTPGTPPTNWSISAGGAGMSRQVVGTGVENGLPYIDVRLFGTNSAGSTQFPSITPEQSAAGTSGQTWTTAITVSLVGGSTAGITGGLVQINTAEYDNSPSFVTGSVTAFAPSATPQRIAHTRTLNNAATTIVRGYVNFPVPNGNSYDITLRVAGPQLEQATFATSPIITTGASATRGADAVSLTHNFGPEGTLFIRYRPLISSTQAVRRYLLNLNDLNNNRFSVRSADASGRYPQFAYGTGSAVIGLVPATDQVVGSVNKVAVAWSATAATGQAISLNGGLIKDTTAAAAPSFAANPSAFLGAVDGAGNNCGSLVIERIDYYPTRLSDAQLQTLTQ
jgi:hypothetical protein